MASCSPWRGFIRSDGYGQLGRATLAHRAAWEAKHGAVPDGCCVHHVCGNKSCVNVAHLELMSRGDHNRHHHADARGKANARRRAAPRCKHGHEFNEANTYWTRAGTRSCRRCDQARPRRASRPKAAR